MVGYKSLRLCQRNKNREAPKLKGKEMEKC
ncbi:MAG: hypothetical protein JWP88_1733 [Flaviaesturariibacter sp.]|nr:hypothetical protein [Flaviaesturariibacter sp.]